MKKKMNKVLVVCTAAAAMTAFSGTAFGATLDLESKTAVADAKDGAGDIQEAINQISGNGNKDGWTIKIKSGTYDRFTIPADFKNITVEGEKNSVIQVMNASVADNLSDAGGINAFGSNITLKGLTIDAGNVPAEEGKFTAAVSNHNGAVGGTGFSLHVENCTIKGTDSQFADGILFDSPGFDVKNCKISGFKQAVEFFGDNFVVPESGNMVSGNTVRDCSFAIHGYFGGGSDGGVLSFKNNKVTGTDDLRAKVNAALRIKLPLFCSEFSACDASGNGNYDFSSANKWISLMNRNKISYCCWSLSNKPESASLLKSSCKKISGFKTSDLSKMGRYIVKKYRKK